ncbi:MAG: glycine zipper 2TM domain-containing protein [Aestuariivita sp.]|nr:glycine zipper 2TM domain-containing protein [Aestuariivita sp.]MCY4201184.1 glycine zipper 2TM domain-containing protein [Aestuariivita sp.]MCY4289850.1 glycine zipper 2TM domain-containing protein [Aestuariivita sp.]
MTHIGRSARLGTSLALILTLSACQSSNELAGTLIGGAAGAVIGDQFGSGSGNKAAIALGAIIGANVGRSIGASLDQTSRQRVGQATYDAIHTGNEIAWENQTNSGGPAYGSSRITNRGRTGDGRECREFLNTVVIGGRKEQAYGVACRTASGDWKIV